MAKRVGTHRASGYRGAVGGKLAGRRALGRGRLPPQPYLAVGGGAGGDNGTNMGGNGAGGLVVVWEYS